MRIDIWSDIVCPFCLIGKTELATALSNFPYADEVQIALRAFELDPGKKGNHGPVVDHLVAKYGLTREQAEQSNHQVAQRAASLGLQFNWRQAQDACTHDAHRLVKAASADGIGPQVESALMAGFFTGAQDVSDRAVLTGLATRAGLDPARVAEVLGSDAYSDDVRADEAEARRLGISGVPFFLFEGKYGVSGAQSAATFGQALGQVWQLTHAA